jgi:hypothetical protein
MLGFVSNAGFGPLPAAGTEQSFSGMNQADIDLFNTALSAEHAGYQPTHLSLFHFLPAGIPFEDYETHLTGYVVQCVKRHLGDIDYNPDAFVRALIDECRRKSKPYTKSTAYMDTFQHKFLTKGNVTEHLAALHKRSSTRVRWEEVANDLGDIPFSEKMAIRDGWRSYEADLLEVSNVRINAFRDRLRVLIRATRTNATFATLSAFAEAVRSRLSDADVPTTADPVRYVTAAILFEAYSNDASRTV